MSARDDAKASILNAPYDWSRWPKLAGIFAERPRINVYWLELADFIASMPQHYVEVPVAPPALAAPPAGAGAETAKGTTMKPADILIAAAERLERLGWCQGSYGGPAGPNCVRGAISRVVGDVEVGTQARWMLSRAIDTPVDRLTTWNDDPARTKEEVVAALRRAASALAGTGGRR